MTHAAMHTSTHKEIYFNVFTSHHLGNRSRKNIDNIPISIAACYPSQLEVSRDTVLTSLISISTFEMKKHNQHVVKMCLSHFFFFFLNVKKLFQ